MSDLPTAASEQAKKKKQLRTAIALGLLALVLAIGVFVYMDQQAKIRTQTDEIGLSVDCLIAGGHVVTQAGRGICVSEDGRVLELPPH